MSHAVDGPDEARPFAESLCWCCAHRRVIQAARSEFLMCTTLVVKYQRQPVVTCAAFHAAPADGGTNAVTPRDGALSRR